MGYPFTSFNSLEKYQAVHQDDDDEKQLTAFIDIVMEYLDEDTSKCNEAVGS